MTTPFDDIVYAYEERVPLNDATIQGAQGMGAHILFSLFTADIISENKVFVR